MKVGGRRVASVGKAGWRWEEGEKSTEKGYRDGQAGARQELRGTGA